MELASLLVSSRSHTQVKTGGSLACYHNCLNIRVVTTESSLACKDSVQPKIVLGLFLFSILLDLITNGFSPSPALAILGQ